MYAEPKVQALSAIASTAIVAGLALALILGLRVTNIVEQAQNLASVVFAPEPPPPPPQEKHRPLPRTETAAAKGDPAPRNLKNRATQIVAPPMPMILKPPPIVTAPVANVGDAASNGASDLPGPGQGAGGEGVGFGGGGQGGLGNGRGGGGGGQAVHDPRAIRDKLRTADIPEEIWPSERGPLNIEVLYLINANGRVSDCRAIASSGDPRADSYVCRLIEERFLFHPARNRFGQPVAIKSIQHHEFNYR